MHFALVSHYSMRHSLVVRSLPAETFALASLTTDRTHMLTYRDPDNNSREARLRPIGPACDLGL